MNKDIFNDIIKNLEINPIIPCTKNYREIFSSEYKDIRTIFLHNAGIYELNEIKEINAVNKKIIVLNIDSIGGISPDIQGARYLKEHFNINAIHSSSSKLINHFGKLGFLTIQSVFLVDTPSIEKVIQLIQ